jgi:hypothetical protein
VPFQLLLYFKPQKKFITGHKNTPYKLSRMPSSSDVRANNVTQQLARTIDKAV